MKSIQNACGVCYSIISAGTYSATNATNVRFCESNLPGLQGQIADKSVKTTVYRFTYPLFAIVCVVVAPKPPNITVKDPPLCEQP